MDIVAFYVLFALWVVSFSVYFYIIAQQNNYVILFVGIVPGILMLIYGVGGILLQTLSPQDRYSFYEVYFTNFDLVCVLLYVILVSFLFFVSFQLAGKCKTSSKKKGLNWRNQFKFDRRTVHRAAIVMLLFDIFIRMLKLSTGTYMDWVAAHVHGLPYWTTALFQLESFLIPLLGVFIYVLSRENKWAKCILLLLAVLVLFEGDRSTFLIFVIPIVFAYLYFNQIRPSFYFIAKVLLFLFFFFGFLGPAIQEVRYAVRDDMQIILESPKRIPISLITNYIPNNVTLAKLYGDENRRGQSALKRRLMNWPAFWASINSQIRAGKSFRGVNEGFNTMALCIPSFLFPGEKPEITSGKDNLDWYDLYVRSNDPTSTVFVDAFAIGGIYALVLVSAIFGCLFGFLARFLINKWGALGVIIFFGLVNNIIITRDSFGVVFVNFRNSFLMIILLYILFQLSKLRLYHSKKREYCFEGDR